MPWVPGMLSQATDRIHRIGQENKTNIYYLMGNNSIDEVIMNTIKKKTSIIKAILEGEGLK